MNEPLGQFSDKEFGFCKIIFNRRAKLEKVCLFASHTSSPLFPEYIYYYLAEIKKSDLSIVFISSSIISEADLKRLSSICDLVIEKENKGADFGAWCFALRYLNYGRDYEILYLCNDSVFGPLIPFFEIHQKFQSISEDILGITDSYQGGYHIQSYFVGVKKNVLQSIQWKEFWESLKFQKERVQIIEHHEIGLSTALLKNNKYFIWANWVDKIDYRNILLKVSQSDILRPRWLNRVLYEKKEIVRDINPNSFLWKELLLKCGSPFIKRELFIYPNLFEEGELDSSWEAVLEKRSSYPGGLINFFLIDYFFNNKLKNHLGHYAKTKLLTPTANAENVRRSVVNQINNAEPFFVLDAIESLLQPSPIQLTDEHSQWCKELEQLKIDFSSVVFSSETKCFQSMFIYLTASIVELSQFSLNRIKTILKRIVNPIVIVPDKGLSIIASKLLSLRSNTIIIEKDFYNPVNNKRIIDTFSVILSAYEEGERLNLFEKYTLADVTMDALKGTNKSGFISLEQIYESIEGESNREFYSSGEEYQNYIAIKNKYLILYENTPLWYKKFGQIIKVVRGHKRLIIDFKDKGAKNVYRPTAEDLIHWYYHQYEVLPKWYKKIGKKLIKKA